MLVSSLSVSFAPQLVSRPCVSSSCVRMSAGDSYLSKVPMGPPDAILGIAEAFKASTVPGKVNVAVGAYRDDQGSPWVLPAVRAAEAKLIERGENKEIPWKDFWPTIAKTLPEKTVQRMMVIPAAAAGPAAAVPAVWQSLALQTAA